MKTPQNTINNSTSFTQNDMMKLSNIINENHSLTKKPINTLTTSTRSSSRTANLFARFPPSSAPRSRRAPKASRAAKKRARAAVAPRRTRNAHTDVKGTSEKQLDSLSFTSKRKSTYSNFSIDLFPPQPKSYSNHMVGPTTTTITTTTMKTTITTRTTTTTRMAKAQTVKAETSKAQTVKSQTMKTYGAAYCRARAQLPRNLHLSCDALHVLPPDFTYVDHLVYSRAARQKAKTFLEVVVHCNCDGDCASASTLRAGANYNNDYYNSVGCNCRDRHLEGCRDAGMTNIVMPYHRRSRKLQLPHPLAIHECLASCQCPPTCSNRLVQKGHTTKHMEIFWTETKGWGLRTLESLQAGEFVAEYTGEVVCNKEADIRQQLYSNHAATGSLSYMFDMDGANVLADVSGGRPSVLFTIDGSRHGNFSRFFNHGCNPNLITRTVLYDSLDPRLHHIGFFCLKDIAAGDELVFDYQGIAYSQPLQQGKPAFKNQTRSTGSAFKCHCNSIHCRQMITIG